MKRLFVTAFLAILLLSATGLVAADQTTGPGWVMRYADIGGGQIVFTYEGDLWLVPETGGDAHRITSHAGTELAAKFSHDGKQLAFTAGYDGGNDVYIMDARGGVPTRLTFHPTGDLVLDWCPDDKGIIFNSNREYPSYSTELYRVPVARRHAHAAAHRSGQSGCGGPGSQWSGVQPHRPPHPHLEALRGRAWPRTSG